MAMNLGHLSIFRAVAGERNISRAAERLMISQPAVSKQLAQLERSLGTKLVDRLPRGIRLTEAGELLASYARRLFAMETEAEAAVLELRGLRRGRLRLGASTTLGVYLLPEAFVRFRETYPDIQITLEVIGSPAVERRVLDGDLDMGFTESFSGSAELDAIAFGDDQLVAIAQYGHPLSRKRRVSAEQFCQQPFVVRETGSETKSFVEQALAAKGLSVRPVMSLGTTEAIKRAVSAGIGVSIVSKLAIELELKARRLSIIHVSGLSISRPIYRVQRSRSELSPAALRFLELLKT
jgi:DNA-binding transcriptional LysR family regulator